MVGRFGPWDSGFVPLRRDMCCYFSKDLLKRHAINMMSMLGMTFCDSIFNVRAFLHLNRKRAQYATYITVKNLDNLPITS
ncbi:hypothetical protein ACTXT7_014387, partial [Hymenolepis weldensis]